MNKKLHIKIRQVLAAPLKKASISCELEEKSVCAFFAQALLEAADQATVKDFLTVREEAAEK